LVVCGLETRGVIIPNSLLTKLEAASVIKV